MTLLPSVSNCESKNSFLHNQRFARLRRIFRCHRTRADGECQGHCGHSESRGRQRCLHQRAGVSETRDGHKI